MNADYGRGFEDGKAKAEFDAVRFLAAVVEAAGGRIAVPDRLLVDGPKVIQRWTDPMKSCEVLSTRLDVEP